MHFPRGTPFIQLSSFPRCLQFSVYWWGPWAGIPSFPVTIPLVSLSFRSCLDSHVDGTSTCIASLACLGDLMLQQTPYFSSSFNLSLSTHPTPTTVSELWVQLCCGCVSWDGDAISLLFSVFCLIMVFCDGLCLLKEVSLMRGNNNTYMCV